MGKDAGINQFLLQFQAYITLRPSTVMQYLSTSSLSIFRVEPSSCLRSASDTRSSPKMRNWGCITLMRLPVWNRVEWKIEVRASVEPALLLEARPLKPLLFLLSTVKPSYWGGSIILTFFTAPLTPSITLSSLQSAISPITHQTPSFFTLNETFTIIYQSPVHLKYSSNALWHRYLSVDCAYQSNLSYSCWLSLMLSSLPNRREGSFLTWVTFAGGICSSDWLWVRLWIMKELERPGFLKEVLSIEASLAFLRLAPWSSYCSSSSSERLWGSLLVISSFFRFLGIFLPFASSSYSCTISSSSCLTMGDTCFSPKKSSALLMLHANSAILSNFLFPPFPLTTCGSCFSYYCSYNCVYCDRPMKLEIAFGAMLYFWRTWGLRGFSDLTGGYAFEGAFEEFSLVLIDLAGATFYLVVSKLNCPVPYSFFAVVFCGACFFCVGSCCLNVSSFMSWKSATRSISYLSAPPPPSIPLFGKLALNQLRSVLLPFHWLGIMGLCVCCSPTTPYWEQLGR
ncbi:hypothetical protein FGO68_gene12494 [Halteria grandinella]|uniref:Uncharacterized protein n=1 Tax=Halteria grandinella TaxID=5974 RepID=A0A8J8NQP2_HALGN|nr:hypothetical protein FGO68_gene12494 [Halteria grandinella]